ncbi:hypothetical protein [Streptomyces peucetius]|uniref:Uncharacterized protein n=1 Tax=Streptomyces peucetius TaxID=1950 RepID=A0ABY6IBY1_STRPE|nr:hypothetical protein [Streptomyces peucetius]UYQ64488.1 hypothetical protein OGH68_25485 [Streptomyces peucetius]
MLVTAENEHDMEVFLRCVGEALARQKAKTTIDLYVDDDNLAIDAQEAFAILRSRGDAVASSGGATFLSRLLRQKDPYMGCDLDLSNDEDRRFFSLLAHRVIGCESWIDDEQVFSSSGASGPVWVGMGDSIENDLIGSARKAGANSLRIIDVGN